MREAFLALGPGISTQELARRAGVSEGTLFKRFGSKRVMFTRALRLPEPKEREWFKLAGGRPEGVPLEAHLEAIGRDLHAFLSEVIPHMQMIAANGKLQPQDLVALIGDDEDDCPPLAGQIRMEALFAREIAARGIRTLDPADLAQMFLGAIVNDAHQRQFFDEIMTRKPGEVIVGVSRTVARLLWAEGVVAAASKGAPTLAPAEANG